MAEKKEEEPIPEIQTPFDEVDERMVVISFRAWIGLGALAIIFVAVLIWAFFGSITLNVEGRGISLTLGGVLNIPSLLNGQITEIYVEKGQTVKKGTPLVKIYDYKLEIELKTATEKMNSLKKDLISARKIAQAEDKVRKEGIRQNIEALKYAINKRQDQLPFLKKDLEAKQKLYKEGLVSASQKEQAVRNLMEENIRIEDLEAKIASLNADLEKSYKSDELKSYERLYRDSADDVQRLKAKNVYQDITSPFNGRILELQTKSGEEVKEGQPIVWLEKENTKAKNLRFFCFVPAEMGNRVKKGMTATLQLFNVDPQKQGYLMGTVDEISLYPVTALYIYSMVQSKDLVEFLTNKQPALIEVVVSPIPDPESYSGFRWTSGKGPQIKVHSGLLSFVKIAVEKRKPISYVFPEWWLPKQTEEN